MIKKWLEKRTGIKNDPLNKGWKEFLLSTGVTLSPQAAEAPPVPMAAPKVQQQASAELPPTPLLPRHDHQDSVIPGSHKDPMLKRYSGLGSRPEDVFLWNLAQVESSGGKNFAHRQISSGMHRGHKAIGSWGLMPNTVKEIVNRKRRSSFKLDPEIKKLQNMDHQQMKEHIEANPEVELKLARHLARHVLDRQKGNEHKAAYSWLMGHNMSRSSMPSNLKDHYYVQRYKKYNESNPFRATTMGPVLKSEDLSFSEKFKLWQEKRTKKAQERKVSTNESYVYSDDYKPDSEPPPTVEEILAQWGKK